MLYGLAIISIWGLSGFMCPCESVFSACLWVCETLVGNSAGRPRDLEPGRAFRLDAFLAKAAGIGGQTP